MRLLGPPLLSCILAAATGVGAAETGFPAYLRARETRLTPNESEYWRHGELFEWRRVADRHEAAPPRWDDWLGRSALAGPERQLVEVQRLFSPARFPYVHQNDGADRWKTPREFISEGSGDCKGYAVTVYFALRRLGWPAQSLRLVLVASRSDGPADHAVIAARLDGRVFVLDQQAPALFEESEFGDYRPVLALNEEGMWTFEAMER